MHMLFFRRCSVNPKLINANLQIFYFGLANLTYDPMKSQKASAQFRLGFDRQSLKSVGQISQLAELHFIVAVA